MNDQIYRPNPTGNMFDLENIDAAYRLAGIPVPTRGAEVFELIESQAAVDEVAVAELRAGLEADDLTAWLDRAIAVTSRALAVKTLRDGLASARSAVMDEKLPELRAGAAKDLAPAFARTCRALSKAAAKLPAGHDPLDLDAVVEADATREMKEARAALADLAVFAAIVPVMQGGHVPPRADTLLPIVGIPDGPVERVTGWAGQDVIGDGHSMQRRAVRTFAGDAQEHGPDRALIGLARGEYSGLAFALADSVDEVLRRHTALDDALRREYVEMPHGRRGVVVF
ncbi:MAG: hypothetical protein BGO26_16670 [Actinobacteria bacterium 69-20]|nr:hypothetical protein [Actinomycetota bacterium]OJV27106.1 MAG: hypothetical protein BGO26_16670 [Actinobacteria bacterium 69-20]